MGNLCQGLYDGVQHQSAVCAGNNSFYPVPPVLDVPNPDVYEGEGGRERLSQRCPCWHLERPQALFLFGLISQLVPQFVTLRFTAAPPLICSLQGWRQHPKDPPNTPLRDSRNLIALFLVAIPICGFKLKADSATRAGDKKLITVHALRTAPTHRWMLTCHFCFLLAASGGTRRELHGEETPLNVTNEVRWDRRAKR